MNRPMTEFFSFRLWVEMAGSVPGLSLGLGVMAWDQEGLRAHCFLGSGICRCRLSPVSSLVPQWRLAEGEMVFAASEGSC